MITEALKCGFPWHAQFNFEGVRYHRHFWTREEAVAFEAGIRSGEVRCMGQRKRPRAPKVRCSICKELKPLEYDHDHGSGKFRGWLCRSCNWMLGVAKDRPEVFENAASYLRERAKASEPDEQ